MEPSGAVRMMFLGEAKGGRSPGGADWSASYDGVRSSAAGPGDPHAMAELEIRRPEADPHRVVKQTEELRN